MADGLRGDVGRQLLWLSGLLVRGDTLKLTPGGPALVHYGVVVAMGTEAVASKLAGRQEKSSADSFDRDIRPYRLQLEGHYNQNQS